MASGDQFVFEMLQGLAKIAVDRLADDGRIDVGRDGQLRAFVEQQQTVQHDVKRVDREFKLTLHRVHKLELHISAQIVGQ